MLVNIANIWQKPKNMRPYKYAFWNNKRSVGKTFLCFAVASEYALQHPDVKVVVIDMCPQANVSEILLGSSDCEGQIFMESDQIL